MFMTEFHSEKIDLYEPIVPSIYYLLQSMHVCINKRIILPIPLHPPQKLPHGLIFKTPWHAALFFNFHVSPLSSPQHLLPNLGQIHLSFIEKPLSKILPESGLSSGVEMLSEAGAASGPGLPWEHPPELLSLLGLLAPFLELFPLYGDLSTPSVCI